VTDNDLFDPERDFDLDGEWADAARSIARMWTEGVDPRDLILPKGYGSTIGVERYARAYCEANPRADLALMYGIASVGVCVAAQGGIVLECPLGEGAGTLPVPVVEGFVGIAPSGGRKSTTLNTVREPLEKALEVGVAIRLQAAAADMAAAKQARQNAGLPIDDKQMSLVYNAAICGDTLVRDPTPEALRNAAVMNGGVAAGMTGEADILDVGRYSKNGGSLTVFLEGWDQAAIEVARVNQGVLKINHAAVMVAVLLQPEVFAEATGGDSANGDNYIARGAFGRWLVARGQQVTDFSAMAKEFSAEYGTTGLSDRHGVLTPLGEAQLAYEQALVSLVRETSGYRAAKAMRRAWEKARAEYGADLTVDEVQAQDRQEWMLDTAAAREAYGSAQKLQLALSALLHRFADEDTKSVFTPLVERITQHVMRGAMVQALGADKRGLDAATITDIATRVLVWRIAHTTDALLQRASEVGTMTMERAALANPRGVALDVPTQVLKVMAKMAAEDNYARQVGWTPSEIARKVIVPRNQRRGITGVVRSALIELAADQRSGIIARDTGENAVGAIVWRFVISAECAARINQALI
jgi:hypothetical protein